MYSDEQLTIDIKKAFDDKELYFKNQKLIFDYSKILEYNTEIINYFNEKPRDFIVYLKSEMELRYGKIFQIDYRGLEEEELISNFRVEHLGKVFKVTGMISNATGVIAMVEKRYWDCFACGGVIVTPGREPKKCTCGKKGGFTLKDTKYQDVQELILEENQDDIGDRSPRKTRVRLLDELCDKEMNGIVRDGNKVEVIGIVEEIPLRKDNKTEEELYQFRLFALQVRSLENEFDETITEEDINKIEEISKDEPLKKLANSLVPGMIGNSKIKKAVVLSLVGGVPRSMYGGKKEKNVIHILLVGDAGMGKSLLIQEAVRRHYKSKYLTGERLSAPGLTLSVEKDEILGAWALKAGYLPKSNKGFVGLDELDKAPKDVQKALHTPMESGIVTIAKASISATLNAECTLLVGANPKNSKFDKNKNLVEQIDMESTLLSRFDLIFPMIDKINRETDFNIAESIWEEMAVEEVLSVDFMKKYFKYVQKFKPKITESAKELINKFYVDVREKSRGAGSGIEGMPIVPRHLKGIRRLSEASAKLRLSNLIEEEDAKIAIDLFKESVFSLGLNEEGIIDLAMMGPGRTATQKKLLEVIMENLRKIMDNAEKGVPIMGVTNEEITKVMEEQGVNSFKTQTALEQLQKEGFLFRNNSLWKIV